MTTLTATAGSTTVDLTNGVWCRVPDGSGLLRGAALRSQNQVVPGVHGEAISVLQVYSAGAVVVPLVVLGVDRVTGLQVGDGTAQLRDNLRYLSRVFHAPTVTLTHEWPDGAQVQAVGRMQGDPFEGERWVSNPPGSQVSVALGIPGAFWTDVTPVVGSTRTLATGGTAVLTEFADATAPMDELVITFGPCSNPRLYQEDTGSVIAYQGVISSGRQLTVDTADWALGIGSGAAWTPDYSDLRYTPRARWFELDPTVGTPTIRFEHTGGGSATVQITARRKYFVGG